MAVGSNKRIAQRRAQRKYEQTPRGQYQIHKRDARRRGIEFCFTFDEWLAVWQSSGHFDARGNKTASGYVMARHGDRGPYAVGNVTIKSHAANIAERNRNFAAARRAGISWDWYRQAPIESGKTDSGMTEYDPDYPDVPF